MKIRKYSLRQISDLFVQIDQFDIDDESGETYLLDDVSILQINKINVVELKSSDMKRNTRIVGFTFMLNYRSNVAFLKYTTTTELKENMGIFDPVKSDRMENEIPNQFEFDGNKTDFETFMQLSIQLIKI